jgi:hypothetical protein
MSTAPPPFAISTMLSVTPRGIGLPSGPITVCEVVASRRLIVTRYTERHPGQVLRCTLFFAPTRITFLHSGQLNW